MFICRLICLQIVNVRNDLIKKRDVLKKRNIYDNTGSTVDF